MALSGTKLSEFLNWKWENENTPYPLHEYLKAPEAFGLYELGEMVKGVFVAKYVGRAAGVTLRGRLAKHSRRSHNLQVRASAHKLFFRFRVINSAPLASYIEAVSIVALDYPFNRRNEWHQHWALES
ncbi:hypothetical protein VVD49_11625 [Uliginosibacterium sp. H3]|uniref:GIY-YIG domain-containing protein n=1 Tax=Uliginosibacterium silvisoli TaxID=3114758 RepID=A0ABU6K4B4_9RHOO|nr:hypothetical protein [Uliginosibacterium sp. H3]